MFLLVYVENSISKCWQFWKPKINAASTIGSLCKYQFERIVENIIVNDLGINHNRRNNFETYAKTIINTLSKEGTTCDKTTSIYHMLLDIETIITNQINLTVKYTLQKLLVLWRMCPSNILLPFKMLDGCWILNFICWKMYSMINYFIFTSCIWLF